MMELFLAGTLSGVGCSSPVGLASTGMGPADNRKLECYNVTGMSVQFIWSSLTSSHATTLLGHLIVTRIKILLTFSQSLLEEGRLAATSWTASNG